MRQSSREWKEFAQDCDMTVELLDYLQIYPIVKWGKLVFVRMHATVCS